MQALIEYVRIKSLTDTSMAMAYKMMMENVDQQEDCLLALFEALYTTNRKLADEVLRQRKAAKTAIVTPD
jgi:hypothetical protein